MRSGFDGLVSWTKPIRRGVATGLCVAAVWSGSSAAQAGEDGMGSVLVTAAAGERQSLLGVGAGQNFNAIDGYRQLTDAQKKQIEDVFWTGLDFNALRIWLPVGEYAPSPGVTDLDAAFTDPYLEMVRGAVARGVDQIVVTAAGVPEYMKHQRQVDNVNRGSGTVTQTVLRPEQVRAHADALAGYVHDVWTTHGIEIDAVSLQNEPDVPNHPGELYYNAALMVEGIKTLRAALDDRGLTHVKVVGPESSSADDTAARYLNALRDDPEAWDALGGLATHSYNIGSSERFYDFTQPPEPPEYAGPAKEYWQTESSSFGPEHPGDANSALHASAVAARFLNDVNHGVTHWFHFVGFMENDPNDNATRILKYDPVTGPAAGDGDPLGTPDDGDWFTVLTKYHYLQQLTDAFDLGATFRKPTSDLEGDMSWQYGPKPRITTTVAQNPDGSWAIAINNYTDNSFLALDDPERVESDFAAWNAGQPSESFEVTVFIEELADLGDVWLTAALSGPVADGEAQLLENELQENILLRDGFATVTVDPLQLLTLRTVAVPEPGVLITALGVAGLIILRRRGNRGA